MISFSTKTFEQLSTKELYVILKLRAEVFVVEQQCVYMDMDDKDYRCLHVLGYHGEELAAYTRLVPQGISYQEPSIGRVVTNPLYRKHGYGKLLMEYSINQTLKSYNSSVIVISAQQYLERFYTTLGFITEGGVYLEDEIPHIKMRYLKS